MEFNSASWSKLLKPPRPLPLHSTGFNVSWIRLALKTWRHGSGQKANVILRSEMIDDHAEAQSTWISSGSAAAGCREVRLELGRVGRKVCIHTALSAGLSARNLQVWVLGSRYRQMLQTIMTLNCFGSQDYAGGLCTSIKDAEKCAAQKALNDFVGGFE